MSKFHINKNGVPAPCRATKGNCPLGGEGQHFDNKEDAQEYADKKNKENYGLIKGIKSSFGIGQIKADNISEHREKYLKKIAKENSQENLDSLVYAINTIEEEDGMVGKTTIGKKANRIHTFDAKKITPERRFSDIIDHVNKLPKDERNRYFNKIDDTLGINSTEGFISKNNENAPGLMKGLKKTFGIGQIKADNIYQHREVYLKKKVKGDPQEKLKSLVYAINTIEEEDGMVGKTTIGKKANRIYNFDAKKITPERRFSDIINHVNKLPEGERDRYFNKIDGILGVDSTTGFTSS